MISLVSLQKVTVPIRVTELRQKLESAFGTAFTHSPDDENAVLVHETDMIPLKVEGLNFGVIRSQQRYCEDPPVHLKALNPGLYAAMQEHQGFVAVDTFERFVRSEARLYRIIGKILAELLDHDPVVLLSPQFQQVLMLTLSDAHQCLRGPAPWRATGVAIRPNVLIPQDHPHVVAATEEARSRMSEFLAVLKGIPIDSAKPVAKAVFKVGDIEEVMWFRIESLTGDRLLGVLDSTPRYTDALSEGDMVSVDTADIVDWGYVDTSGKGIGCFSNAALVSCPRSPRVIEHLFSRASVPRIV